MNNINRRNFIKASAGILLTTQIRPADKVVTVQGSIAASKMGTTLVHEHFLVDFIGADKITPDRWDKNLVEEKVLPYLMEAKKMGVQTIVDCTPAFLGRDAILLKNLSNKSGLHLITNTGYYGAGGNNKFLPAWVHTETAEEIAQRWQSEYNTGIENTSVRPGFIKIGVGGETLSVVHKKLVKAAALTHLKTGLLICSHTGKAGLAFEQIDVLKKHNVHPSAFVWVHAQAEDKQELYIKAAQMGAWVSLDGIGWGDFEKYARSIHYLKTAGYLHKVLISHDAGWYKPGEEEGGKFTGFTNIFKELIPRLQAKGFTQKDIQQLLVKNPSTAFTIKIRKI